MNSSTDDFVIRRSDNIPESLENKIQEIEIDFSLLSENSIAAYWNANQQTLLHSQVKLKRNEMITVERTKLIEEILSKKFDITKVPEIQFRNTLTTGTIRRESWVSLSGSVLRSLWPIILGADQDADQNKDKEYELGMKRIGMIEIPRLEGQVTYKRRRKYSFDSTKCGRNIFTECIRYIFSSTNRLLEERIEHTGIRAFHATLHGKEVGIFSLCLKLKLATNMSYIVGVMYQTSSSPKKAISISFKKTYDMSRNFDSKIEIACTCAERSGYSIDEESCIHIFEIRSDMEIIEKVEHVFRGIDYNEGHCNENSSIFGTPIDTDSYVPSLCFRRDFGENYTMRTKSHMRKYMYWIVFDRLRELFVCVTETDNKMQCQFCRGSSNRRIMCVHENSCSREHEIENKCTSHSSKNIDDSENNSTADDYLNNQLKRSILPCEKEEWMTTQIVSMIQRTDYGSALTLQDPINVNCRKCGTCRSENSKIAKRIITLFTAFMGNRHIMVIDWTCMHCEHINKYTGEYHGVFPCTKNSAYCNELLYIWVQKCCYQGQSFRDCYESTRIDARSASNRVRQVGITKFPGIRVLEWSRRSANNAFRNFIKTIDVSRKDLTDILFSCSKCERTVKQSDSKQLKGETDISQLKYFSSVVIDGTAAGILSDVPKFEKKEHILSSHGYIRQRIISTREIQKSFRLFFSTIRKGLRDCTSNEKPENVITLNRKIWIDCKNTSSGSNDIFITTRQLDIVKWFANSKKCNCDYNDISTSPFKDCLCPMLHKIAGKDFLKSIMKSFFKFHNKNEISSMSERGRDSESYCTFIFDIMSHYVQMADSIIKFIDYMFLEHIMSCYLSPFSSESSNTMNSLTMNLTEQNLSNLAFESLMLHRKILKVFCNFKECPCSDKICFPCQELLLAGRDRICKINPLVGIILEHMNSMQSAMSKDIKLIANKLEKILLYHIQLAEKYCSDVQCKYPENVEKYWKRYGKVLLDPISQSEPISSGMCFPGRIQVRPTIMFDTGETHQCNKQYFASEKFSPGLLTVQCTCSHPKLIGFYIMTRAESTSTAISSVVTHFPVIPQTVFYDNGCNMFSSCLIRMPWFLKMTRVCVDRFHYKSHKCSDLFDPDQYALYDNVVTVGAESLNARIQKTSNYTRYLNAENFIPSLVIRFALLNLASISRERKGVVDTEDEDIGKVYRSLLGCSCTICSFSIQELEKKMNSTISIIELQSSDLSVSYDAEKDFDNSLLDEEDSI